MQCRLTVKCVMLNNAQKLFIIFCLWAAFLTFVFANGPGAPELELEKYEAKATVDTMGENPPPRTVKKDLNDDLRRIKLDAEAKSKEAQKIAEARVMGDAPADKEKSRFRKTLLSSKMELPDIYRAGFYIFLGISSVTIVFIIVRIYRLRLSRAERKYGVQGDRANQELTPLPMAIEDINSDDEDQTLFDVSRQNMRIL